jgi:ribosome-associated toxin RatA of RatAB toxin-antitoxin module
VGASAAEHAEVIAASPEACLAALLDFASYPDWQSAVKDAEVLERGSDPLVEFHIDAKIRTVRYVLRYHPEPPSRLWWEYVEGDLRSVSGEYALEDLGDGTTRATYRLEIDPGRFVPGPIRKALTEGVMRGSVRELKARVES